MYGIRGKQLELFKSFLTERTETVEVKHRDSIGLQIKGTSKPSAVSCGVPQGSLLGPILFSIYLNDLPASTSSRLVMYADDTGIVIEADNLQTLKQRILDSLNTVVSWYQSNRLQINVDKTNLLIFTPKKNMVTVNQMVLNNTLIPCTNAVRILGIIIENQLSWNEHLELLSQKLNRAIFHPYPQKRGYNRTQ